LKYTATNELSHFQYHDAKIEEINIDEKQMTFVVSALNATTENSQNNFQEDMCIKKAIMIFEDVSIRGITFYGHDVWDTNNVKIDSVPSVNAKPEDFFKILLNPENIPCYIMWMEKLSVIDCKQRIAFDILSNAELYALEISFSKAIVSWDEFCGKAWYLKRKGNE